MTRQCGALCDAGTRHLLSCERMAFRQQRPLTLLGPGGHSCSPGTGEFCQEKERARMLVNQGACLKAGLRETGIRKG